MAVFSGNRIEACSNLVNISANGFNSNDICQIPLFTLKILFDFQITINTEEDFHAVPIYVTGHCKPDADLSVAAIDYAVQEGRTAY